MGLRTGLGPGLRSGLGSDGAVKFPIARKPHLVAGAQAFKAGHTDRRGLTYGQSITDACIGWDDSAGLLRELADAVRARRARR
jgi:3-deoxy-7-phosphoheptulonate synthase